ncbi:MAG: hydroxyacid dehydrogenase [Anaerolineae bacterium]|nr:hydroxyacid dehydrogenase [Anaerolineae bacterium]
MRILVNQPIHPAALELLRQRTDVLTPYAAPAAEITRLLATVDGLLLCAGYSIGAAEMDRAPNLRVVGRHGVGLDNVDLEAATARGLPIVYTPYAPTESTAEHAFMLIMAAARQLPVLDRATRAGHFAIRNQDDVTGIELRGKRLGIVGFGRIGRRLAEMCRAALDMPVYAYDPFVAPHEIADWGATPVSDLLALAREVDVLSLHVPATPATVHLIDATVLAALKPTAILVNAARGPIVDQVALARALAEGALYGAGIDVYDPEPPSPDNPLLRNDRVVLTPHVASKTIEGRRLMGLTVAEDILRVLDGQLPHYLANPTVWDHRRDA